MVLVTTPTGNTGRHVLSEVIKSGQPVRILVRNKSKMEESVRRRCEIVEGDLRDEAALARAAAGVEAAFFCTPQSGVSDDIAEYYRSFATPAAKVFHQAGVRRIVTISGGRGNPNDLGPSGPLAIMEKIFDATGMATRHVRCGFFMEGVLWWIPQMKFKGSFSLPLPANDPLSMEAAEDIGKTAARYLLDAEWSGHEGVEVPFGQGLTPIEIADTLSNVLGKKIRYAQLTGNEFKAMLMKYGVSEAMGQCLKEMYEDIDNGSMGDARHKKQSAGITLAQWAQVHLKPQMGIVSVLRRIVSS